MSTIFEHPYHVWRQLQHGQEKIIRWSVWLEKYPKEIREQNGHEHRCSVGFLFTHSLIKIRPYLKLDELLLSRAIDLHDVPEGILGVDTPAPFKKDENDRDEYLAFEQLFKPLGEETWKELQRCFLLQFALENPVCFPDDARAVMDDIQKIHRNEALFFQGVQSVDYMYYCFECYHERGINDLLVEICPRQVPKLEKIASELPGFKEVVWTPQVKDFFVKFWPEYKS